MLTSYPRPTGYPLWASGTSGAAAITQPDANTLALGWGVAQSPPSSFFNWLNSLTGAWIAYLDVNARVQPYLGDASDGDLILGATTYVMTRHMNFGDVALGQSSILDTQGFIPLIRGSLTGVSGTIRSNGQAGGTGASGVPGIMGAPAPGPLGGGWGSGTGLTGGGIRLFGQSVLNSLRGGYGGTGGSGKAGAGLAGGTCVSPSGLWRKLPQIADGIVAWQTPTGGATMAYFQGGAGGEQGGGDSGSGGGPGAGGGGGSVILLPCTEVNFQGTIQARGGTGGPALLGTGGGGGGGGGWIVVAYAKKSNLSVFVDCAGGVGGPIGATGNAGGIGGTGATSVVEVNLGA